MNRFIFDLQRFDALTINAGETYALDGVTYTAQDDAQLNLDGDGKVSGIASGSVTATVTDAETSPTVTFDATDGAINFTATGNGEVLTVTTIFPIEFISGAFTYKGNALAISAGSDLAIVSQRDGYSLRNENHFIKDSAYIFSSTALTSDAEHVVSTFILTNGTETRELNLEQLGTVVNNFAESGFTLVKGSSEVLNLGSYKLTATAKDADAGLNLDLGAAGITFVPNQGDGTLNVSLSRGDTTIFGGELECTNGSITLGYDKAVTFAKDTSFKFTTPNNTVLTVTANDEATTAITLTDNGITFTPGTGDGGLNIALTKDGTPVFGGELNITDGSITFDSDAKKFSFTEGTKIALAIGTDNVQVMDVEIVGGDASFKMEANADGSFTITPDANDGSLNIAIKQNGEVTFQNTVTVNGAMTINPVTNLLTLKDGTTVNLAFNNYTLTATASGDAASTISLTEDGISITPELGDGKLNLTLTGTSSGSMSVDVEVLSGGFLFGTNGALNVVEGTELQIKFSDDYIINFKATDAAGGAISIGADGLSFAPNSEDGGLQLSVTRNGETRSASLDVTGSLTYKLDGSISLAKDTVVKNVFEDGNILTITANTDASGSILFSPQNGLTIEPSTADALTVALTTGELEVAKFSSITGSINYNGGIVTASDGATADLLLYGEWATKLSTSGGTVSLQFTGDRTVYTANEGATFVLDYLDGSTVEIQNGTFSDIYATDTEDAIELISAGSTFRSNDDEFIFTLETAGNYTLNGMNVTTASDNVKVQLSDYDTITVDGMSYTALDDNVTLTIGEDGTTVTGGEVNLTFEGMNTLFNFDTTNGSLTFDSEDKLSITAGTVIYLRQDNFVIQLTAKEDISATAIHTRFDIPYFKWDGTPTFALATINNGTTTFGGDLTFGGGFGHGYSDSSFSLIDSNSYDIHDSYMELALGNYKIKLATDGDTSFATLDMSNAGKILVNYTNNDYNAPKLTMSRGDDVIFDGSISVTGSIILDTENHTVGLADGASVAVNFNDYKITTTANGDFTSGVVFSQDSLSITPSGKLDITFENATSTTNATLEVLSGSFTLDNGALNIAKDTELELDFGGGYVVNLKATDAAGGALSIGADGISFAPNADDGGLEISVTRDGVTRTASLDVTGSITYKLDGSISLTQGTVVKNVFEDGNILTITALTDASGSMIFTPNNGLDITPSTPNALDILLSRDGTDIIEISGITGSVNYKGGAFTASDGTTIHFVDPAGYYDDNELRTSGGTTTVHFGENGIDYTPGENATFTMDYLQGTTWELQNGTLTDYFAGPVQGNIVLSEGATFDTNDNKFPFALENAGNYTLNGMKVTTASDNVQVLMTDYDKITVDGISYKALDDAAQLTFDSDGKVSGLAGGSVQATLADADDSPTITFDATDGAIDFAATDDDALAVTLGGRVFKFTEGTATVTGDKVTTGAVKFSIAGTYSKADYEFTVEDSSEFSITADAFNISSEKFSVSVSAGGSTLNFDVSGTAIRNFTDHTFALAGGTTVSAAFGEYTITATATDEAGGGISFTSKGVTFAPNAEDGSLNITISHAGTPIFSNVLSLSNGSIAFNPTTQEISIVAGTKISSTRGEQVITLTVSEDVSASYKVEDEIFYLMLDDSAKANISVVRSGQTVIDNANFEVGGVFSYRPETGTFGLTGASSSYGDGTNTFAQLTLNGQDGSRTFRAETNDVTLVFIPTYDDGKIEFNFPNEDKHAMKFTISNDGQTVFESNITVDGTVGIDPDTQEISLTKGTVLTLTQGTNELKITALDETGGVLTVTDDGIRFVPNADDGELELSFVNTGRKANLNVTGAIVLNNDGKLSLEDGTEINFTWEDGNKLKLTSSGSTGSIGFGDKGLQITSDDENLDLELTMAYGYSTKVSGLKGSLWYNAGRVILDDGTHLTGTGTLGNNVIDVSLETIDGDAYLDFSTSNGFVYGAGTGKLKVTYALGDLESTFIVNSGSVLFGNAVSTIAKGTDLATDLKNFMPAMNFTTSEAGTYTINGQTITTSAEGLALTATDDQMVFKTSGDVVTYDGMTFAGNGNVSLKPSEVVLGAGVVATGFGEGNSFVLAEAGNVTADAKIFELSKIEGTSREIPMIITVTGAQDGFIFSRTLTKESEAYLDDALDDDEAFENYSSPYIGQVFTEKFISAGDSSYRIRTDAIGLEDVIGISDGATVTGGASLGDEPTLSYYDLVTDTEGTFTIGEKSYNISGDSSVAITARFEAGTEPYASAVKNLNGTVSGDFTGGAFSINGSSALQVLGDSAIDIVANANGMEMFNVSDNATLANYGGVSKVNTDTEGTFTFGATEDNSIAVTVRGDDNVTFEFDDAQFITSITNLEGNISFSETDLSTAINGISGTFSGEFSSIGAYSGALYIHDVQDGSALVTDDADKIWLQMLGTSFALNGNSLTLQDDSDGIWIRDKEITGLDKSALLRVSETDTYIVNSTTINANADDYIVGVSESFAYCLAMTDNTVITGTEYGDYIANNGLSVTINALGGNDVLINYAASNVTVNGGDGNDRILNVVRVNQSTGEVLTSPDNVLINGEAGNDSIQNGGANVTINAGAGDDSISNSGDNVTFQYSAGDGNDTIQGFNATSTLSIAEAYSTAVSGNDLIVTVGDSKITLLDAAGLSAPNIESTAQNPIVTLVEAALKRTAAGYPEIAAVAFHPDEDLGDEPTNYAAKEDWTITSTDDLKLHAVHYTPENSNDKWVVLIHGYGHYHNAMYQYATAYLANGYNVLMIDQRAAGESEGEWLTMGAAESKDVALWTQEIARRNSNAKITLHGVSMGSATAMLAAARSDTKNVTSLIEDCGYTNVLEVFSIINEAYLQQPPAVVTAMDIVAASLTGYYLHEAAPIDSISSAKMPSLFITGDDDTVVPMSMLSELYEASGADVKETFIVEGATHGRAGLTDSIGYGNAVFRFVAEADGEGWTTASATDNISLRGTKYDDNITNSGASVSIDTGDGNDTILTTGKEVYLDGGNGADWIETDGASSTISGGNGADSISNIGASVSIDAGDDNDYVENIAAFVTISGGLGDDSIDNGGKYTTLLGGAGNDSIRNIKGTFISTNESFASGNNFIDGGEGNDTIENSGESVTIQAGAGDDSIINVGENVLFKYAAGDGNDTIQGFNATSKLLIDGGSYSTTASGDDVIVNVSDDKIVLKGATALDDLNIIAGQAIENLDTDTIITATESDDTILNYADNVTINLRGGNDLVENYGDSSVIDGGADADVIINMAKNVTINGDDGPDSIANSEGANVSINAGAGNDEIYNSHAYYPTIEGGAGNDSIVVERGHYANIDGGAGNDTILGVIEETIEDSWAMGGYATLNGGDGDDYINTESSDSASINGGAGNDTIITGGNDATINGGAGDDIISLQGASVDNNVIEYETGDGNDLIYGLNSTGIVSLTTGAEYSTAVSGDDVILTVGENKITVAGASSVNVVNYKIEPLDIENTKNNTLVSGSRLDDIINNEGNNVTIDAGAGKDTVFNFGASASINGGADNDSISNTDAPNVTINGDYGDDVLWNNSDKALIEGSYGNDTLYNSGDDVTIKPGGGHDSIFNDGGASLVIDYSGGNDTIYGFNETSTLQIGGGSGIYDTLEGIRNVLVFTDDNIVVLENALLDTDSININGKTIAVETKAIEFLLTDNDVSITRSNISVNSGDGNDTISNSGSNVTINAGGGSNIIKMDEQTASFVVLNGNTTVEGFNTGFGKGSDTVYIDGDPAGVEFKDGVLAFGNSTDSLTMSDITTTAKVNIYHKRREVLNKGVFIAAGDWYKVEDSDLTVNAGEEVYFVGTAADPKAGVDFSDISSALNITMNTAYIDSEDYVPGTTTWINGVYSLKGGAGLTTITGSDQSDTIFAGTGSTTIDGAGGNDKISLGSAQALVKYTAGDGSDLIQGFNENSTLSIAGDEFSSTTRGNDLILSVGDDKITLVGAADLEDAHIIGTSSGGSDTQQSGGDDTQQSGGSDTQQSGGSDTQQSGGSDTQQSGGSDVSWQDIYDNASTIGSGSSSSTTSGGSDSSSATSSGSSSTSPIYNDHSTPKATSDPSLDMIIAKANATAKAADGYTYTGGDQVIANYASEQKITLGTFPTGYIFGDGNFALTSDSGSLLIQDAYDKVIDLRDGAGNPFAKAYAATNAGLIDGRGLAGFEVIKGSDGGSDMIYAGDNGSSLWGGNGSDSDTLVGGGGTDIFVGGRTQGADTFVNASASDVVFFSDATLGDVIASAGTDNAVAVAFNTGNVVLVGSSEQISAAFMLADGSAYRYNHSSKAWQNA